MIILKRNYLLIIYLCINANMKIISQNLQENIRSILNQFFLDLLKIKDDYTFISVFFLVTFLRLIHLSQPIK